MAISPEQRDLTKVAADVHDDLSRLSLALQRAGGDPDSLSGLHRLMTDIGAVADVLAASGAGRAKAGGLQRDAGSRDLFSLTADLSTDLLKLTIGLHQAGLTDPTALQRLTMAIDLMKRTAQALATSPDIASLPVADDVPIAGPNIAPLASTLPGARPTTLDLAGRRLQAQLRAKRQGGGPVPAGLSAADQLEIAMHQRAAQASGFRR